MKTRFISCLLVCVGFEWVSWSIFRHIGRRVPSGAPFLAPKRGQVVASDSNCTFSFFLSVSPFLAFLFLFFFAPGDFRLPLIPSTARRGFPRVHGNPVKKKTRYETKSTTGRKRLLTGRTSMKSYKTQLNLLRADQDHEDGYDGSGISLL